MNLRNSHSHRFRLEMLTIYVRDWDADSVAVRATEVGLEISGLLDQAGDLISVCVRVTHQSH